MLTPMDIHNHEFKKSFRGYNENEVDEFLDRIVSDYERVLRENEKLKERANLNEKEISHYKNLEQNLQDTLMVAQKTAEEVINSARKNAKDIRENATNEAQSVHENTMREAQNIRVQAQLDAKHQMDEAANKLHAVVTEYDRIVREKNAFLLKMRTALESELAVITQLLSSIPGPNETESIKAAALKIEQGLKVYDAISQPVKKSDVPATSKVSNPAESKIADAKSKSDNKDKPDEPVAYAPVKKN